MNFSEKQSDPFPVKEIFANKPARQIKQKALLLYVCAEKAIGFVSKAPEKVIIRFVKGHKKFKK
jgi:hypothetical protein